MMRPLALLACAALAGCALTHYDKPGGTAEQFEQAAAACRAQAAFLPSAPVPLPHALVPSHEAPGVALAGAGAGLQQASAQLGFMDDCLRAQGWRPAP